MAGFEIEQGQPLPDDAQYALAASFRASKEGASSRTAKRCPVGRLGMLILGGLHHKYRLRREVA